MRQGNWEAGGERSGRLGRAAVCEVWESRHRHAMGRNSAGKGARQRGNDAETNGAESALTGCRRG